MGLTKCKYGLLSFLSPFLMACIVLYILSSCSRPVKDSDYISLNPLVGWQKDSVLKLSLELPSDTVATIDLYLTFQILNNAEIKKANKLLIDIDFISPLGNLYFDSVILPIEERANIHRIQKNGVLELCFPYILNIRNKESGVWNFKVKQNINSDACKNIIGLGLFYKVKE